MKIEIVDPNATTLPMHSTPGIDSPVIRIQTAGTEYISPVFDVPPQSAANRDQPTHQTDLLQLFHYCDYQVSVHKRGIEFATSPKLCCCTTL